MAIKEPKGKYLEVRRDDAGLSWGPAVIAAAFLVSVHLFAVEAFFGGRESPWGCAGAWILGVGMVLGILLLGVEMAYVLYLGWAGRIETAEERPPTGPIHYKKVPLGHYGAKYERRDIAEAFEAFLAARSRFNAHQEARRAAIREIVETEDTTLSAREVWRRLKAYGHRCSIRTVWDDLGVLGLHDDG